MRLPRVCVDTASLIHNYRTMQRLAPASLCGAVVKANAYGLGLVPVVPLLAGAGCRLFYVASLDEGVAVRRLLQDHGAPTPDIVVFHGYVPEEIPVYKQHAILPVLKTPQALSSWFSGDHGPAVVEWDTGMHRCGLSPALAEAVSRLDPTRLHHIMTHLAAADCPDYPLNQKQKECFAGIARLFSQVATSIGASHGVLLGPEYHGDYVRIGIALYGGVVHPDLRSVVQVHAPVLEVRTIAAGESVGYGASYIAPRPSRIMTVGFGYADGYLRSFSNTGQALIQTKNGTCFDVPVVGRVSMDVTTLDATDVPEAVVAGADTVVFYHPQQGGIIAAAHRAGTIPYELLTSLKPTLGRWVVD
ncbi:MAG: alanine racemase [Alphaproteobacteria bacterium]